MRITVTTEGLFSKKLLPNGAENIMIKTEILKWAGIDIESVEG